MRGYSISALALLIAAPATAQMVQPPKMAVDPADRAVMAEVATIIADRSPDIARLDAVLAKVPRPTPLRGMVQTIRAGVLASAQDAGPAVAAVEDALRLLPDDPRPKLTASYIFTFAGSPQRAADLWLQASRESPDLARQSDRYLMTALVGRLNDIGDRSRADRVSARLGDIGFSTGLAPERSDAALARTREAVRSQRESEALQAVTTIGDPTDLLSLYIDKRYSALWPRIAEWADPDLMSQSRRYLEELRRDWRATDDFETAAPYARRLANLQAHDAVIGLFLPMFDRLQPGHTYDGVEFLAPVVARTLGSVGRAAEARTLLAKVATVMPAPDQGNALNIDGGYLTLATMEMDWPQVIDRADRFLGRATVLGSIVNRSAVLDVLSWRACALWRTNRTAEAQQVTAEILLNQAVAPRPVMQMHLCRGDEAAARALVIARLSDESTRTWALNFVQPKTSKPLTPLDRWMVPLTRAVTTAPDVVAAANRVGRILPKPIDAMLPDGFDPFRVSPSQSQHPPGSI